MDNGNQHYRTIAAGDQTGTAIAVAYEIWRAELKAQIRENGPGAFAEKAGDVEKFNVMSARRIGYYARCLLRKLEHDEGEAF